MSLASILPVRARSRRCEALIPVCAAASRNDNRSSAKAASVRGYSGPSIGSVRPPKDRRTRTLREKRTTKTFEACPGR